jgi:hypothetical protein
VNSQEHHQEAEKLLTELRKPQDKYAGLAQQVQPVPGQPRKMSREELLALAQVHATLALAAATETLVIGTGSTSRHPDS